MNLSANALRVFKESRFLLLLLILAVFSLNYADAEEERDSLFQTSILEAFAVGVYDGDFTFGDLKKHGDFGLGTFNRLDGEMIALDGVFYQVKSDGKTHIVEDSMKTPFAAVTFFEADDTLSPDQKLSCKELEGYIENALPTKNIYYAIKVKGSFEYMKTRSVPAQVRPYPPLGDVVKVASKFEFNNIGGAIVGFRLPGYMENINQTWFHFHFITDDKKAGGHVLDCKINDVTIEIDYTGSLELSLPDTDYFNNADLIKSVKNE